MNLTDAVAKQVTAELDAIDRGRKNLDAGVKQAEADGYRIVEGGQISSGDEDYLCEYTDWRTGEVLYRGSGDDQPDARITEPPGWYNIDAIHYDYDGLVAAEKVAGLPKNLADAINDWVCENEEDARAWLQTGQGGSITVTVPARLFE